MAPRVPRVGEAMAPAGGALQAQRILALQRLYGNRVVGRLVSDARPDADTADPATDRPAAPARVAASADPAAGLTPAANDALTSAPHGANGQPAAPPAAPAAPATGAATGTAAAAPRDAATAADTRAAVPADTRVAEGSRGRAAAAPLAGGAAPPAGDAAAGAANGADLLASLADVPASSLAATVASASGAASALHAREKRAAQAALPVIDIPTGMPAAAVRRPAAAQPPQPGRLADVRAPAGTAVPEPRPLEPARGPLPGSQVSVAAAEPAAADDEGGSSWWSWLTDRLRSFFGALPTSDPNVSTSAGERQRVSLTGEADPSHSDRQLEADRGSVAGNRIRADMATEADFGESAVAPDRADGTLRASYRPAPVPAPRRSQPSVPPRLPTDEQARFDEHAAPWVASQVRQQEAAQRREQHKYEQASEKAQDDGARKLAEANERTRGEQFDLRRTLQADVAGERKRWREQNRKIEADFGDKAGARRREIDREIGSKLETTHRDADAKLQAAEHEAATAKTRAEEEAATRKREEENKPRSWWDRVKGAVSDAFNMIRSAITSIFDKLRQVVKGIIDGARRLVHGLIEAARAAIVGLIKGFGEFLKGLVTIALAAFPELAERSRAWIDARVDDATAAVNRAAKALHRAADAIFDGIAVAVDLALDVMQSALMASLDLLEAAALLPFQALEALAKLVEWVEKNGKFVLAAMRTQTDGDSLIDALKNAIGGMLAEVPGRAMTKVGEIAASFGAGPVALPAAPAPAAARASAGARPLQRSPDPEAPARTGRHVPASTHVEGVLRHLGKGLDHLKSHWWEEVKKVGWNLLWPWPAVWSDLKDIWKEVKAGFEDAYHLRVGKVIDHVLAADQKLNSILGNLYGWFFIASVLIGAIVGAFFGGAGAIPGALAGATFAGEVGVALLVALVATEAAVIAKSVADLAIGNDSDAQDEEDYGKIAGSTLTLAITGAMVLLGELAAKLAQSVWEAASGLFRGKAEKAPEVRVEVDAEGGKPADAPEAKVDAPEVVDGERVVAKEGTSDGHEVKITEEGRCLVCSICEDIDIRYREELKAESPEIDAIKGELETARKMPNGQEKADAVARVKEQLDEVRAKVREAEPLQAKADALAKAKVESRGAIENTKARLDSPEARKLGEIDTVKPEVNRLRGEIGELERQWSQAQAELDRALADARDPSIASEPDFAVEAGRDVDALRSRMEDLHSQAERVRRDVDRLIDEHVPAPQEAITIQPDVPIIRQLEGKGQLRDLRSNPNLRGVDLEALLQKTPNELDQMVTAGTLDAGTKRTIMKAFEGRDLGGRRGG